MYEILFNDISVSFNENFYPQAISLHFPIIQNFLKNYKKIFYLKKKKDLFNICRMITIYKEYKLIYHQIINYTTDVCRTDINLKGDGFDTVCCFSFFLVFNFICFYKFTLYNSNCYGNSAKYLCKI